MRIARIAHLPPLTWLASIVAAVVQVMRSWNLLDDEFRRRGQGGPGKRPLQAGQSRADGNGPVSHRQGRRGNGHGQFVRNETFQPRVADGTDDEIVGLPVFQSTDGILKGRTHIIRCGVYLTLSSHLDPISRHRGIGNRVPSQSEGVKRHNRRWRRSGKDKLRGERAFQPRAADCGDGEVVGFP